ncbi:MAG: squalene--hopene cyclase [Planctomyces sp.]|nr:squalene--hopene cyclase [Planctomyces sp.]
MSGLAADAPRLSERQEAEVESNLRRARDWLLDQQHLEGHWIGELEGDSILESEYILLLTYLGRGQSEIARACANTIRGQQLAGGGWAMFPGGPLEISASVKAYWALKIVGDDPNAEHMRRACEAIRAAGGAEKVNSFTRYYLALLGVISYRQCPAIPPELMFIPKWSPFNIYEMSAWSRTILVPLSLLWAFQPCVPVSDAENIRELFLKTPEELPVVMHDCQQLDALSRRTRLNWSAVFRGVDRVWKGLERMRLMPLRQRAIRRAARWMMERFEGSDGLGAIFPPIVWSIVALKCLGYSEESPEIRTALGELEKLTLRDGDEAWLEPCRSPVWDTAISIIALRDAGVPESDPQIQQAAAWLLSKEIRRAGDWSVRRPDVEPSGWAFEFHNEFYPDVDDTIMVLMALARVLPDQADVDWTTAFAPDRTTGSMIQIETAVLAARTSDPRRAVERLSAAQPILEAMRRGMNWILSMQSRNGGWGAFDADNTRELLTRVPFADHNAMIDPPTADITARTLEMFGRCGAAPTLSALARALDFVWASQESDGAWYGRWGVNYLYGTWQVLVGLEAIGVPSSDPRVQRAAAWLKSKQQASGGWGETACSYDHPELRGEGIATASQTAWAVLGLIAAGEAGSLSVTRGIRFLTETQTAEGTWEETEFTGTGFPKVFYLRYHLYRHYFPLMALGRHLQSCGGVPEHSPLRVSGTSDEG